MQLSRQKMYVVQPERLAVRVDPRPRPRRMCFVSPSWPPSDHGNGIVSYVGEMQSSIAALGHKAYVASSHTKANADKSEVDSAFQIRPWRPKFCRIANAVGRRLTNRNLLFNSHIIGLRQTIEQLYQSHKIELLEIEESFGNAISLNRCLPIPTIVRLHGPWFLNGAAEGVVDDDNYRMRIEQEGLAIKSAAGISAPCKSVLDKVRCHYGLELADARVIANPIRAAAPGEYWRRDVAEPHTILFVGRFDRLKGGDIVLQSFNELVSAHPDAKLIFIGADNGINVKGTVNQQLGIADFAKEHLSVRALRSLTYLGRQPQSVIDQYRRRASVTIVASRLENCPYALLEAMRLGAPVVATNVGGIPEIVQDGKTGLLVPSGDSAKLAEAILRLLDSPAFSAEMGEAAAHIIAERFNPRSIARQTLDFYDEVIARWRGR